MRAYERLLNYVRVYTTSDPESGTHPSAEREFDLARQLVEEMKALGIEDARVDAVSYTHLDVYKRQSRQSVRTVRVPYQPSVSLLST